MRKFRFQFISLISSLALIFLLTIPAFASSESEYIQKSNFFHWSKDVPLWGDWIAYTSGETCPVAEDKYHRSSTYYAELEDGYFDCICSYCGAHFTAYESDLQQSYAAQVEELPASGITSTGCLLYQFTVDDIAFPISIYSFSFQEGFVNSKATASVKSNSVLSFSSSYGKTLYDPGYLSLRFFAPISGTYGSIGSISYDYSYVMPDGASGNIKAYYAGSNYFHCSLGEVCSFGHAHGTSLGSYSYISGDVHLSAPVIKCKKTPRKKCRFVAEARKKR